MESDAKGRDPALGMPRDSNVRESRLANPIIFAVPHCDHSDCHFQCDWSQHDSLNDCRSLGDAARRTDHRMDEQGRENIVGEKSFSYTAEQY
jgi:hypothetical protein